jgi:hypothetical protein
MTIRDKDNVGLKKQKMAVSTCAREPSVSAAGVGSACGEKQEKERCFNLKLEPRIASSHGSHHSGFFL